MYLLIVRDQVSHPYKTTGSNCNFVNSNLCTFIQQTVWQRTASGNPGFNHLNPELNPICHLLPLLETHQILHVNRVRVNVGLQLNFSFCLLSHQRSFNYVTPESIRIVVLGEPKPCCLVKTHRHFRGTFCCANGYQPTGHHNPVSSEQQRNLLQICT